MNADILVLTETSSLIHPGGEYISCCTTPLRGVKFRNQETYAESENRVTIWSKYPASPVKTHDPGATACACVRTPLGELIVYGTVIGIYGRGNPEFGDDLENQIQDWRTLGEKGNLCIAGDFNQTLGDDNSYYSKAGRQKLETSLRDLEISVPTQTLAGNIDHIALPTLLLRAFPSDPSVWIDDKNTSTHKGICIYLKPLAMA